VKESNAMENQKLDVIDLRRSNGRTSTIRIEASRDPNPRRVFVPTLVLAPLPVVTSP